MVIHLRRIGQRDAASAFSLLEVLIAFVALALVISGLLYGYVLANRMSEWSAMSLAAQSYASQGAEQARAADWRPRDPCTNTGPNTPDELPPTNYMLAGINYILDIPIKGNPASTNFAFFVTNYVCVSNVNPSVGVSLRQIRSDAVWTFSYTGQAYTNTVILQRAADQ